ncbi:MAG: site-2 protease family protein [Chloroflexia bacterium]
METSDIALLLREAVSDFFAVEAILLDAETAGLVRLYGRFLSDSAEAYPLARERMKRLGYTPLFREEKGRHLIIALPGQPPSSQPNLKVAGILLALTIFSTLFAGMEEYDPARSFLLNLLSGLPFAATLLAILLAHEMGHYLVARRLGIPTTLPYFIPMPLSFLGTMGAFIQMKAPPQNRRHLLAVGLAGPLAGLVVAIPLLILGLSTAHIGPSPVDRPYFLEGNSLLYALLKMAVLGRFVPDCSLGTPETLPEIVRTALYGCPYGQGWDVMLSPVAFAAWAGLLVTGLNLIPAGTLDGGHVAYALLGKRAQYLTWGLIAALVLLGFLWNGWFIWAALIFLLGRRPAVPLDDVTRLKPYQVAAGIVVLIIFLLTFTPIPLTLIAPAGPPGDLVHTLGPLAGKAVPPVGLLLLGR